MKRPCCWMAVIFICLYSTGCREDADRWNKKARSALMGAHQEEAIGFFNKALALDPDNLEAHFSLGWIYEIQGRADESISEFKKAIVISPNHAGAHNHLGDLYLAKGMLAEAIESFKKVVVIHPDSAKAYYSLGVAYKRQGAFAEAADALFEAGLLALIRNDKSLALNAYNSLKETGNQQLAGELQGVLSPWFDPANEAVTQHE